MNKKRLARAIATAMTGTALSAGGMSTASAAATTMYNTFTAGGLTSSTDGWTRIYDNGTTSPGVATGPESQGNKGTIVPWVGTTGSALPDVYSAGVNNGAYAGSSHLNWAVSIGSVGDLAEISATDSNTRYGFAAEIDTGAGAWQDAGLDFNGNPTANGPTGWKHQTDIGLIKTDQNMWVTLKPSVLTGGDPDFVGNFGITVFTGADTNTGNYSHHGAWNRPGSTPALPYTASNPFGTTGVNYLTHDGTVDSVNGLTFYALANQTYSIYLGGAGVGNWSQNLADYKLNITTSAVPVPAAVWLFGSALAGMGIIGRRKDRAVAAA